ncbi:hypothetical protein CRU87_10690 [Aliarcobacter trophiarum LMG 25534]|uniref:Uncharacterized protein n=1 Tax=Aliarcobacter trophiarum LMG 25534 TaxID=1032241 RepID=A0ABY0EWT4_9BACT|nr:hypothetical protein CRU87_10690 [Aliarcobacter trophiarum LMG 25534]
MYKSQAKKDMIFEATVLGVLTMALNGELATISSKSSGLGTFYKSYLITGSYNHLTPPAESPVYVLVVFGSVTKKAADP